MKRRLLITVSGMVGSGKTTAAQHVIATMQRNGVTSTYWRFQRLPCVTLRLRGSDTSRTTTSVRTRPAAYTQKRLTLTRALGYAARIVAFEAYRRLPGSPTVAVSNRYFYDNLVHYRHDTVPSRMFWRLLKGMIPKPDLALLLVAAPATLAERRPAYSPEYIRAAHAAYRRLGESVPELLIVSSEPGERTLDHVQRAVEETVLRAMS
jgi:thymidylate kinase